jgi:UDP-N-acetylmuramate dehydrogenase
MIIERDRSLKMLNTMRIDSKVDYYIKLNDFKEIFKAVHLAKKHSLRILFLGNGSNILFAKNRYKNMAIIDLKGLNRITETDDKISVEAGVSIGKFLNFCIKNSIKDYEFLSGIPGSIGGAVFMNAGAFGQEIGEFVINLEIYDSDEDKIYTLHKKDLSFSYRSLENFNNKVILKVNLRKNKGDKKEIKDKIQYFLLKRREKQPKGFSLGSVYKNGKDFFAGALIEKAKLKGENIGDAYVSEKHANFIINRGSATGDDVLKLMHKIEKNVFDKFSVKLIREVKVYF